MQHLSLMMRQGLAVTHTGGMDYFLHPERIAGTRLLLLQGSQNYIFHPVGSLKTLRWLRDCNPAGRLPAGGAAGLRPPRRDRREPGPRSTCTRDREFLDLRSAAGVRRVRAGVSPAGGPVADRGQPEFLGRAHARPP